LITRQDHYLQGGPRNRSPSSPSHTPPSRLASVRAALRRNQDLSRNAISLVSTTGVTSALGFAFWTAAARFFPAANVGYGSAAISTMVLLGVIGVFGHDTMLMGELPRSRDRGGLIMAACIATFMMSAALGLGFAVVSLAFGTHFIELNGTVGRIAVFSVGVATTGATTVFDAATIGLLRGGIQLTRNTALSIVKVAFLPVVAVVLHDAFGVDIVLAWVLGNVVSLLPVAIMIKRGGGRIWYRPAWGDLWRRRKVTLSHNTLNLANAIPVRLVPVLVAVVVSPEANGAYYIANMIFGLLFIVPQSLSGVLFAVASAAPEKIAEKLRFVLRTSLVIGIPGGLALALCAHSILSVFGASYAAHGTVPLWLLLAGYLPGLPNTVYIALARVEGRFNQAALFLVVFAIFRMAALLVGGKMDGLYGLSVAMLAVQLIQSAITAPPVLRAAFGSVPIRSAVDSVTSDETPLQSTAAEDTGELRLRQQAGLAALVSLAARVAPLQLGPDTDSWAWAMATRPQPMPNDRQPLPNNRSARAPAVSMTRTARPATDADWWPDTNEAAFRSRQEAGLAALIEIARKSQYIDHSRGG
jgi:O-antigen/teichoic acid export membrane protein